MADDGMGTAYRIASQLFRDTLSSKAPELLEDLDRVQQADVIVVRGQYDRIEEVFESAGTPYTLLNPEDLRRTALRPDQIVFVNCPGVLPSAALRNLTGFVEAGGFLFTTDWALRHVLEAAFPGFVSYNQRPTRDEVVRVGLEDMQDPFLASILGPEDDPQWWLENSSYPIRILDPERVSVLVTSKDIEDRYGEAPVFVSFEYGQGRVYHMISHFYLQRSETRTQRHAASSVAYLKEKGITAEQMAKYQEMGTGDLDTACVESAYTSQVFVRRIILEKQRQKTLAGQTDAAREKGAGVEDTTKPSLRR